jgi:hypothetical protein
MYRVQKVNRSGYYAWLYEPVSPCAQANEVFSQVELDAIAHQFNSRPRAIQGIYPPMSVYKALLEEISQPYSLIQ